MITWNNEASGTTTMYKLAVSLSLAAILLASCSGDGPRYSTFSDGSQTYRLNEMTGDIHQVVDGKLIKLVEESSKPNDFSQAEVVEDFELAIRFLDGDYEAAVGSYGILDCFQSKSIDPALNLSRTRAELADVLVACMNEAQWFDATRPAPEPSESSVPNCEDGEQELKAGFTICSSDSDGCDHEEYLGGGVFTCNSDGE